MLGKYRLHSNLKAETHYRRNTLLPLQSARSSAEATVNLALGNDYELKFYLLMILDWPGSDRLKLVTAFHMPMALASHQYARYWTRLTVNKPWFHSLARVVLFQAINSRYNGANVKNVTSTATEINFN